MLSSPTANLRILAWPFHIVRRSFANQPKLFVSPGSDHGLVQLAFARAMGIWGYHVPVSYSDTAPIWILQASPEALLLVLTTLPIGSPADTEFRFGLESLFWNKSLGGKPKLRLDLSNPTPVRQWEVFPRCRLAGATLLAKLGEAASGESFNDRASREFPRFHMLRYKLGLCRFKSQCQRKEPLSFYSSSPIGADLSI